MATIKLNPAITDEVLKDIRDYMRSRQCPGHAAAPSPAHHDTALPQASTNTTTGVSIREAITRIEEQIEQFVGEAKNIREDTPAIRGSPTTRSATRVLEAIGALESKISQIESHTKEIAIGMNNIHKGTMEEIRKVENRMSDKMSVFGIFVVILMIALCITISFYISAPTYPSTQTQYEMAFLETRTLQVAVDLVRARDQTWRELLLREQDLHEQTLREREQTLRKREQAFLEQTTGSHTHPITRSATRTQETIRALEERVDGLARELEKARGERITELRGQEKRATVGMGLKSGAS
ncbi:hypothetical protein V490_04593 [Pseudogymnoascus sp. VKM F-3557]|nr:hypothetical protein V490_04593 [Pseudogymnoascus sp. VKM F-3557]